MQTKLTFKRCKQTGLPLHDDGVGYRVLGALPPAGKQFNMPNYAGTFRTLPESEWVERSLKQWNLRVEDQGRFGSCVGQGTTKGFTYAWLISGQTPQLFSPTFVYAHINGGRDQGAQVSDGLKTIKENGVCLLDQFGPDKIYLRDVSPAAKQTALRFRVIEAYKINSWIELGSALSSGMLVVSGIGVGNNFSNLDRNGVAPLPDQVVGGHCMAHIGLKKIAGQWKAETQNSWSTSWGQGGFCYLQKDAWHPSFGFPFDAFAIGAVIDDPEETQTDPVILKAGKETKHHAV